MGTMDSYSSLSKLKIRADDLEQSRRVVGYCYNYLLKSFILFLKLLEYLSNLA
jgi:hypothetical protein